MLMLPPRWRSLAERSFGQDLGRARVRVGPDVDRLLEGRGALALARDGEEVHLSSRLRALPGNWGPLVLAHELAHLVQQRQEGDDPEPSLEQEAWAAASHALRGLPFRIRGAARKPLACQAFIDARAQSGFPAADDYYLKFRWFPIRAGHMLQVHRVTAIPRSFTLLNLLEKINQKVTRPDENVLIVCHGNREGLAFRLYNGTHFTATRENLAILLDNATPPPGNGLDPQKWARLRNLRNDIVGKRIGHLAVRACNITAPQTRGGIRHFFGAASSSMLTAKEDAFSLYGELNPVHGASAAHWNPWLSQHLSRQVDEEMPHGRVAVHFDRVGGITYRGSMMVESQNALKEWSYRHFPGGPHHLHTGRRFPIHGMFMSRWPNTGQVLFPGDNEYAMHLAWENW